MEATSLQYLLKGIGTISFDAQITSVVTDSRKVEPGCVFVASKGERVDSHTLVPEAIEKGAILAIVDHYIKNAPHEKQVQVSDTLAALIAMGGNYREQYKPVIAAVTGSVGKTTTKEFIYAALSMFGKTLKSEGNKNTEYGMTETLFNLDNTYDYAVVEMGMSAPGDIALLAKAARPNTGIITGIGVSHIEALGSKENILKAKLEICEGLSVGAALVLNKDDELLKNAPLREDLHMVWFALEDDTAEVTAKNIKTEKNGESFVIVDKLFGEFEAFIPALGKHNILDALGAYTLVSRMGLSAKSTAEGLSNYMPAGQRQKIVQYNGITVIEDCYNASPDSMEAALTTMQNLQVSGQKIAVLGDMLELGTISNEMHDAVGRLAAEKGIQAVLTYGQQGKRISNKAKENGILVAEHFETKDALVQKLKTIASAGDALLFKASRGMKFEEIITAFYTEE